MITIHSSGYVISDRSTHSFFIELNEAGEYVDSYDGDATYVVWNLEDMSDPKVHAQASYLPTLIRWLDMKKDNPVRKSKAKATLDYLRDIKRDKS